MTERTRTPYVPTARRAALALEDARFGVRRTDSPAPGLYAWRYTKGAVEVAAELVYAPIPDPDYPDNPMDRSYLWWANVNGQTDLEPSLVPSDTVWSIYTFGRRIERVEYRWLIDTRAWEREHAPGHPGADPKTPVDLRTMDPRLLLL